MKRVLIVFKNPLNQEKGKFPFLFPKFMYLSICAPCSKIHETHSNLAGCASKSQQKGFMQTSFSAISQNRQDGRLQKSFLTGPESRKRGRKVLSVSQILANVRKQKQRKLEQRKRQKPIKPIIPPKSLVIILTDKPEKAIYNRRIIDYKHCGLLQRYIGLGGKILPRRQTRLSAKQQRYIAKTIKSARIMGLLPFVTKERGFFR